MDVLGLLQSKNRCLNRFLKITERFLSAKDLSALPAFEQERESILKALDLYDRKITGVVMGLTDLERTPELSKQVEDALETKHFLVNQILALDEKIIARIEDEKSRLVREMNQTQKTRDTVNKFKSAWIPDSGDGIDETL